MNISRYDDIPIGTHATCPKCGDELHTIDGVTTHVATGKAECNRYVPKVTLTRSDKDGYLTPWDLNH